MLADPQSITIAGTALSFPRVEVGRDVAVYQTADGAYQLRVQQTVNKSRRRTIISIAANKIAADPLTAVNQRLQAGLAITFNAPLDGFSVTELKDIFAGLTTAMAATSHAMTLKALGGEK